MPVSQLIAGVPGAAWQQLHALTERNLLPAFSRLIEGGGLGTLTATRPNTAVPLWTSVATGQPAYRHGLLDRLQVHGDDDDRHLVHADASQRQVPTFWELAARAGRSALVVGWPGSHHGAAHLSADDDCTLVSDLFAWPGIATRDALLRGAIHPPALIERLRDARLAPDEIDAESIGFFVPDWQQVDQDKDPGLASIADALAETLTHQAAFTALLGERDWDLAVVCWPLIARLAPRFGAASAPYDLVMERAYGLIDQLLAHALDQARPERTWLLSADATKPTKARDPNNGNTTAQALRVVRYRGDGFVIASGAGVIGDALITKASVLDLFPTWLAAAGCPIPGALPGRVMTGLFQDGLDPPVGAPAAVATPRAGIDPEPAMSADRRFLSLLDRDAPDPSRVARDIERATNQSRWNRALSLLDDDRPREALPLLEALHKALPEQPTPAAQLAETRLSLRDLGGARAAAEALLDLAPDTPAALLLMARIEREGGHPEAALEHLQRAEASGADSIALHRQIAYTQLYLRRWRDAAGRYDRALALDPEDLACHLGKARALLALRRFSDARASAQRALGLDPDLALARFYLGVALVRLGQPKDGLVALQAAAALAPMSHGAHAWVVRVMKHLKRPSAEISLHLEAMQRIRFQRQRQDSESVRNARASHRNGDGDLDSLQPDTAAEASVDEHFDWSAIDAIPDQPPRPLDLVLISGLPGGGLETLAERLTEAGLNVAGEAPAITSALAALEQFPASEDEIARIHPQLLAGLPRLHHYQVLYVLQPAARIAEALSQPARRHGIPRDEVERLAQRFQRGVVRTLTAMPQVDLLTITPEDLAGTPERLLARITEHLGAHRIGPRTLQRGASGSA